VGIFFAMIVNVLFGEDVLVCKLRDEAPCSGILVEHAG
jgi:hypothetical protein